MSPQAHGNALPEGYRLHWYRIGRVLGKGGFGITYLATDTNLGRQVAIKEYLPVELAVRERDSQVRPFTEDRRHTFLWGLERFIREARTLAQLVHPNIVRVFAVFEANGTAYMVMEYEEGRSFEDIIKFDGVPDEDRLLQIVHPLLDGLEHVHEAGFLHRDIKPSNLYVRADGSPVLLDFGSARQALGNESRTLTSVVSHGYSAFEQYHAEDGREGPWTDIYGMGATLYAALDRGRPAVDAIARGNARLENRPDPLEPASSIGAGRYSSRLLHAIDAALAFKADERPQSVAQWRDLFPPAAGSADSREAPTQIAPPRVAGSRRRSFPAALGLLGALALATGAWWMMSRPGEGPAGDSPVAEQEAAAPEPDGESDPVRGGEGAAGPADQTGGATSERVVDTAGAQPTIGPARTATGPEAAAPDTQARQTETARTATPSGARMETRVAADEARAPAQAASPTAAVFQDALADGSPGPEMTRVPAGRFVMGSPPAESGRTPGEGPQTEVTISSAFALGRFEVTVGEFHQFVEATGHTTLAEKVGGCISARGKQDGATWRAPGFPRKMADDGPVVCIGWSDASAYAAWLGEQTGASYRLPSEAEWEYAARAGSSTARPWGDEAALACRFANVADGTRTGRGGPVSGTAHDCEDGSPGPAPVGRREANALGLHDMIGNVWEWTADCWKETHDDAAADGSPRNSPACRHHTRRGGNFASGTEEARSAARRKGRPPGVGIGFRVARDL